MFQLEEAFVSSSMIKNVTSQLYKSYSVTFEYQITNSTTEARILQYVENVVYVEYVEYVVLWSNS